MEFVNLRVVAWGRLPEVQLNAGGETGQGLPEPLARRDVVFGDGEPAFTPVYRRGDLIEGHALEGPAVLEQLDSTVLIFPGYEAVRDTYGNLLITRKGDDQ